MYYFYVLFSLKDHMLYKGFSADMGKRFLKHASGANKSTAPRRPFVLIYLETFKSKKDAIIRENFAKSPKGNWQLKEYLRNKGVLNNSNKLNVL